MGLFFWVSSSPSSAAFARQQDPASASLQRRDGSINLRGGKGGERRPSNCETKRKRKCKEGHVGSASERNKSPCVFYVFFSLEAAQVVACSELLSWLMFSLAFRSKGAGRIARRVRNVQQIIFRGREGESDPNLSRFDRTVLLCPAFVQRLWSLHTNRNRKQLQTPQPSSPFLPAPTPAARSRRVV